MNLLGLLAAPLKFGFNRAGLVCVTAGPWTLHLFVRPSHWQFWYVEDWYDGPLPSWGMGPLFLLCGFDADVWCYRCDHYICKDRMRHG